MYVDHKGKLKLTHHADS